MGSSNDSYQVSGARGTKILRSTGQDKSSYGDTSTKSLKNSGMKGGPQDISSSITNGKVRKI